MSARLASSVWVSPAAARSALIRSAKAALRAGTIKFFCLPFATSIKVSPGLLVITCKVGVDGWRRALGTSGLGLRSDRCGWVELLAPGGDVLAEEVRGRAGGLPGP